MTTLRLLAVALSASFVLTSCDSFKPVDSRFPTVSQQDAFDLSWGLPARKSRGNPKLRYQYDSRNDVSAQSSAAPSAPEMSAPPPAPIAPIPPEQSRPAIPSNLR